jgi:transcriptional regulator with XRE-family HTH domain
MLQAKLKEVMKDKKLSTREVAIASEVSHTTIVRALRGDIVDLGTVLKLSKWLKVNPSTLLNSMADMESNLSEQIAILLEDNQLLAEEFKKAVEAVIEGKVEPSIIEDIAAYIAFRINLCSSRP